MEFDREIENIDQAAEFAEGNWQQWSNFHLWRNRWLEDHGTDPDDYYIFYTKNCQSGTIDDSNHRVITKAFEPFKDSKDVVDFGAGGAVGKLEGYGVRVYKPGTKKPTEAFQKLWELAEQLRDYPILDESDHSEVQYESDLQGVEMSAEATIGYGEHPDLPEDWVSQVYDWISNSAEHELELEDVDGNGAYPDEDVTKKALISLGFHKEN
jgi:hypothetical protein